MVHLSLLCVSVKALIESRQKDFKEFSCESSSENYMNKIREISQISLLSDYCFCVKILVITYSPRC